MAGHPVKIPRGKPRKHDVELEMLYVDRVDDRSFRCTYQNCWKKFTQVRNCRQHIRNFHLCFLPSNIPDSTTEGNYHLANKHVTTNTSYSAWNQSRSTVNFIWISIILLYAVNSHHIFEGVDLSEQEHHSTDTVNLTNSLPALEFDAAAEGTPDKINSQSIIYNQQPIYQLQEGLVSSDILTVDWLNQYSKLKNKWLSCFNQSTVRASLVANVNITAKVEPTSRTVLITGIIFASFIKLAASF